MEQLSCILIPVEFLTFCFGVSFLGSKIFILCWIWQSFSDFFLLKVVSLISLVKGGKVPDWCASGFQNHLHQCVLGHS